MFLRQLTALSSRRARLVLFTSAKPMLATRLPLATSIRFNSTTTPQPQQPPKKQEPEITNIDPPKKIEVEIKETAAPTTPAAKGPEVEIKESVPAKKPESESKDDVSPPKESKAETPTPKEPEVRKPTPKEPEAEKSSPKQPKVDESTSKEPEAETSTTPEQPNVKKPSPKQPKVEKPTENTTAPAEEAPAGVDEDVDSHLLAPTEKVSESNMHPKLINAFVRKIGPTFTPVQKRCMNEFNDSETGIIVRAKTGTGKTFAFGLPVMNDHLNALDSNPDFAKASLPEKTKNVNTRE
ncbi:unnamed protein product [Ambrosiozyma monospora]|uniref:Unnamed protein product n=1 Tax=Ambrosiozyma monospora TaxID=43982 RepID=A0ACB5ST21_AMBMO|nr:unnamed protein product [Ambrosiozyma monospora]